MSDTDVLTRLDAHEGAFHEWADAVEMTTTDPELTKHRASSYRKAADLLREAAAEILRLRAVEKAAKEHHDALGMSETCGCLFNVNTDERLYDCPLQAALHEKGAEE